MRGVLKLRSWWQRPAPILIALIALAVLNSLAPVGIRPILVKDHDREVGPRNIRKVEFIFSHPRDRPGIDAPHVVGRLSQSTSDTRVAPSLAKYRWLGCHRYVPL